MSKKTNDHRESNEIERRSFLKCMAWAGTGLVWVMNAGVLTSCDLTSKSSNQAGEGEFSFAQISDSHIGFDKEPNQDVTATFRQGIDRINALKQQPAFLLHTGDITHLSTPEQFDTAAQLLKAAKVSQVYYTPGEHDVFTDDGKAYMERYGKGTIGGGWQSFDYKGAHFVGLINVLNLKQGTGKGLGGSGPGQLGPDQLDWVNDDLE